MSFNSQKAREVNKISIFTALKSLKRCFCVGGTFIYNTGRLLLKRILQTVFRNLSGALAPTLSAVLIIAVLSITSIAESNLSQIKKEETFIVLPGNVEAPMWHKAHRALSQDVNELAVYQNFRPSNSAYFDGSVPVSSVESDTNVSGDSPSDSLPVDQFQEDVSTGDTEAGTETEAGGDVETESGSDGLDSSQTLDEEEPSQDEVSDEATSDAVVPDEPEESVSSDESAEVSYGTVSLDSIFVVNRHTSVSLPLLQEVVTEPLVESDVVPEVHTESQSNEAIETEIVPEQQLDVPTEDGEVVHSVEENIDSANPEDVDSATPDTDDAPVDVYEEVVQYESHSPITFSDFSLPNLESGQFIRNVQLRMSLGALMKQVPEGEDVFLDVEFTLGEEWESAGVVLLDEEVSNALNGGYFLFALPHIADVDTLKDLQVRVSYVGDTTYIEGLFVDALWIEVDTEIIDKELLKSRIQPESLTHLKLPAMLEFLSADLDFTRDEVPVFSLRYESQRNIAVRFVRSLFGKDLARVEDVVFKHVTGDVYDIDPELYVTADGLVTIKLPEDALGDLKPGAYEIELVINEGGKEFVDTFEFQWGVLAVNPHQNTYERNEEVAISLGVVSENGNTICDADLRMYVIDPQEYISESTVIASSKCNGNNFIDEPDYSALVSSEIVGTYEVYVEHVDRDGSVLAHTSTSFEVVADAPLSIERKGPTRINPEYVYPMSLTIHAHDAFVGELVEYVPLDFTVGSTTARVVREADMQALYFDVSLNAGETYTFEYSFDAPDISPYLYTLGPAELRDDASQVVVREFVSDEQLWMQESVLTDTAGEEVPSAQLEIVETSETEVDDEMVEVQPEMQEVPLSPQNEDGSATEPEYIGVEEEDEVDVVPDSSEAVVPETSEAGYAEHRKWQIASDATGSMLLYWDGGSVPSGWTCVSCAPSDSFYQRFVMGSSSPGTNGGSATHTHTVSATVSNGTAGASNTGGGGADASTRTHSHTLTPSVAPASNLPPYRKLVLIQHNSAGEPSSIPSGAIALFDAFVPSGWTQYSAQNGTYAYADNIASIGSTGGSATHTHTITGTTGGPSATTNAPGNSGTSVAQEDHVHTINTSSGAINHEPPYIEAVFGKLNTTGAPTTDMIAMWTADAPDNWGTLSSTSEPFADRFVKASATYGTTGGSATHAHVDMSGVVTSGPDAVRNRSTNAANGAGSGGHTHTVSLTGFSTDNHLPPYRTALFAKRNGGAPPTITMYAPFDNERTGTSTPVFEFVGVNVDNEDEVYQIQWDDDADVADAPLGDRASDNEAGCSPNCFENIITPADTSPFTNNEQIRFTATSTFVSGTTYYWRVRAKGAVSDVWGEWSQVYSVTYAEGVTLSKWYQTTDAQFETGLFQSVATDGSDAVQLEVTEAVEALIVYGEGTTQTPRYRVWDGSDWSSESSALSVGGTIQWIRTRAGTQRDEYLLATQDASSDVNVQVYDGVADTWGDLLEVSTGIPDTTRRAVDVVYETNSGDGMVAYCNGSAVSYYVWNGTSWSGPNTTGTVSGNNCNFVRLASDPVSDEIILVTRDTGAQYEAQVWDGSGWGNALTLGSMSETNHEGIAVEYEESGDQALIVVSNGGAGSFAWASWSGTDWSGVSTQALGDDFEFGVLKSDMGSDNMALCYIDNDNDVGIVQWNGLSWSTNQELSTAGNDSDGLAISCEFEVIDGRDGNIMIPYSDTTDASYRVWNGSTYDAEASISTIQDSWTVGSVRTGDGAILAYFHDDVNGRYDFSYWGGSVWSDVETLETSPSVTATPFREPIHMSAKVYNPSEGTILSPVIAFSEVPNQLTWGEVSMSTIEPSGTNVIVQVMYGSGCTSTIPNGALAGNETGFDVTDSPIDLTSLSTTTYSSICLKATLSTSNTSLPSLTDWTVAWERDPYLIQSAYQWYVNENTQTPSDPWPVGAADTAENELIDVPYGPLPGDVVRLRIGARVANVALTSMSRSVKLQYAEGESCDESSVWSDVGDTGSSTAEWRGHNNLLVNDGGTLSAQLLASSTVSATYEEENDSAPNPNSASVDDVLEWDFVLEHQASAGTQYCFRMVYDNGAPLAEYEIYPALITNASPATPSLITPFDNEKTGSTTPVFTFRSADDELNDVRYQIQIDDSPLFDSVNIDRNSESHGALFENIANAADKDPFTQAEIIEFTPNVALSNGVTYYWRIRGFDPDGSAAWGEWSEIRSLTIDTTLSVSAWFQTEQEQFDKNAFSATESTVSDTVTLTSGQPSGVLESTPIHFEWGTSGNGWGALWFTDNETSGDIVYQLEYLEDDAWVVIPDGDLPGNSTGFDASPVSLLGLDTDTYDIIRIVANFTDVSGAPSLLDWTVRWGYKILPPTHTKPFASERVGTTTPIFEFNTSDPQGDALVYQIQWSTSYDFSASTTRTSDTHVGFANITVPADTSPFNSGNTIQFTLQPSDALSNGQTYWWRVRARDPLGDNNYSAFSEPRSITVTIPTTVSTWYQTTQEQFDADLLSGITTITGGATVATTADESLVAYAQGTEQVPRYRTWNGSVWSSEQNALSVDSSIVWTVTRAGITREEYILGTLGSDGDVNVQVFRNGGWGDLTEITATVPNTSARGFDIAYEALSGDAIVVSCDGDADPRYSIWDGTSWVSGGDVTVASSNSCAWVKLIADTTSDEMILVVRDSLGTNYELFVWNGSSWGNTTTLGTMSEAGHEGVAGAYEESGNQAVIVTSNGTASSFAWKAWNGTSWTSAATQALGDDFEAGTLVADVGTDAMALCYVDEDNDIGAIRWTGSGWTGQTELDSGWPGGNTVKNDRPVDCVFEEGGSRDGYIMVTYSDTTNLRYRYWNGASWIAEASISTVQDASRVQVRRVGDGKLQVVAYDIANNRYDYSTWNGSTWSAFQTLESLGVSGTYPYKEPFMIAARNPGSSGSVVGSPAINFYDGSGPYWRELSWSDSEPGSSSLLYQIQYYDTSTESWLLVPDEVLPGNATGIGTSPVDLSAILPVSTYSILRPVANLVCSLGECPTLNEWTITWAEGITVSGTAKEYNQSTNVTSGTVGVAVNGVLQTGKTGSISGGNWTISNVNASVGDVVTVFVTGATDDREAVAVSRYDGVGNMTGFELFEHHLSLGSDDATTTPLTNSDIGLYDFTNSEDLFHNVTGNSLSVCVESTCGDVRLHIKSGVYYRPNGAVTTHDLENNGTLLAGGDTITLSGSWDNNATATLATSTVVFSATSTAETIDVAGAISNTFYNLTFGTGSGSATWTPLQDLDVDNNLTVAYGTLARGGRSVSVAGNLVTGASGFWTGLGTTTFDGSASKVWSDANATKQDVGRVRIDGTSKIVTLGSNVRARSVYIGADDALDASTSHYDITVLTDWINTNTFVARNGEVFMSATTSGHVVTAGGDAFYDLTFNGSGGAWSFTESNLSVSNNVTVSAGILTMPTGTTTIAGSFSSNGGTFAHNNATVIFTGSGAKTVTLNGGPFTNAFYNLRFSGTGPFSFTDAYATTSRNFTITQGAVTLPSARLSVGGSFAQTGGSFVHNSGTVNFTSASAQTIDIHGSAFNSLAFNGAGSWSFVDSAVTAQGSVWVSSGTVTLPSGTLTIGGSYGNFASVNHNSGTVLFNSTDTGETIVAGSSPFNNVTISGVGGGWTITSPATTTGNFALATSTSFTVDAGQTLSVGGQFTNAVGGAATMWTGSILSLESGVYAVNSKTQSGDTYGTLRLKDGTDISVWNSNADAYAIASNASLYSQDHAGVDGYLYIFGTYERVSGTEYWNYATDFDGVPLGGGSRQVHVRFAEASQVHINGATLEILGTDTATTTLKIQDQGLYGITLSNATINAEYYDIEHLNATGLELTGGTIIDSLDSGHFTLSAVAGTLIRVSDDTIDANPGLQLDSVRFDTSLGVTSDVTTGNGEDVFIFFDDFNDGSIDTGKWTKDVELGSITETGGYLRTGGGVTSGNYGHTSLGSEVAYDAFLNNSVVWRARTSVNGIGELVFRGDYGTNRGYKARFDQRTGTNGNAFLEPPYTGWNFSNGTGTCTSDSLEPTADQWYGYEVTATGTSFTMYRDSSLMRSCNDGTFALAGEIALQNHYGSYTDYDWVGVRDFVTPAPTSTAWGSEETIGDAYRKEYVVTGSSAGAQEGYVLPVIVQFGSGTDTGNTMYCDSGCNSDFSDIRFADTNGASLNYWREDGYVTSGSATFWVRFNHIPASPATTSAFVYYGDVVGTNVTQDDGVPSSYWWFRHTSGNLDGESFDADSGNPGSIRWDDSSLDITVSGVVYEDDETTPMGAPVCDDVTQNVRVVVGGGASYTGSCASADGTYSIGGVAIVGDPVLTVYLDTNGGARGTVVTKTPTADITDLHIYENRVTTRHEDTAPLTVADMAGYDAGDDSDIAFYAATSTTNTLTVSAGNELHIASSTTFAPAGVVTLGANALGTSFDGSLHIGSGATFVGYATSTLTVGGSLILEADATFTAGSATVLMNATTTGKTITAPANQEIVFNELVFDGVGGGWNLNADIRAVQNIAVTNGTLTGTADVRVLYGSFSGNGLVSFGSGTTTLERSNTLGGTTPWTFGNIVLGNGVVAGTTTPSVATTTVLGKLTISTGHYLDAQNSVWNLAGTGNVFIEQGTFVEGTSKVRYSGAGATNVHSTTYYDLELMAQGNSPTYTLTGLGAIVQNDLTVGGATTTTFTLTTNDPAFDVDGDVDITSNGVLIASDTASFTVGGSWNNDGVLTASAGTITFDGAGTHAIAAGTSWFGNVVVNGTGSFTFTEHATTSGAFTLTNAGAFTVAPNQSFAVGGVFTNALGGGATTWTDSVLFLYGNGNYTINAKTVSDTYATLRIGGTTQIRMWNGSASAYDVSSLGSLYSQDHAGVDGDLYVYGAYTKNSGVDYWSYATDFDGVSISGTPRQVDVHVASDGSVLYTGGGLSVVGGLSASTTIQNQGSGSYAFRIGGTASTTWSRYVVRDVDASGLTFSGTPNVTSLSRGDIEVSQNSGSAITMGGTVITQNPAKTFTNNIFSTDGVATPAYNVTATGTSVSSWRFTNHSGTISGEGFDVDPNGDPGYVVWDDSAALITVSGNVYSDEGVTTSGVCDGVTNNIVLRVAGLTSYSTSCNASTGAYAITNVAYSPGDSLVVYIDNETEKAVTVTEDPISNISNMHLYENRVIVRHEGVDPLSIADMAVWDSSDDADIPFTAVTGSPDTLTLPSNRKLIVWTGKTFEPNGNVTITGNGAGAAYDGTLELYANATFTGASGESHTVGGSMVSGTGATFSAGDSTFTFTTTGSARTVDTNDAGFHNLTFNGSGSWTVAGTILDVGNDFTISNGAVTLPSATTTIGGSLSVTGGSFIASGGTAVFTGSGAETIQTAGSSFGAVRVQGAGSFTMLDTHATATRDVIIAQGTLTSVSGTFAIGGEFINSATFTHNAGTLRFTSASTTRITAGGSDLHSATFAGGGDYTFTDSDVALLGSLTITDGAVTLVASTTAIGGSFINTGGSFDHASGTVLFNSSDTGEVINPGGSDFYAVMIGGATGGWTISGDATTTSHFTLSTASSFTLASSTHLAVGGMFTNYVGGGATTWTGSALTINSGVPYLINTKVAGGDTYNVVRVGNGTALRAWNSAGTISMTDTESSFYSQDHAGADGVLNVYGNYVRTTGADYWSYATDFDGASLTGSERQVSVYMAEHATTTLMGGSLSIQGANGFDTTVQNQGTGVYALRVLGGTLSALYYSVTHLDIHGLVLSGTPTITSLSEGNFTLSVNGGSLITLASTTLNHNAGLVSSNNTFATTSAITGTNVTLVGATPSAWYFTSHTGNLDGESFDSDGGDACGSVRWSDSACLLTQQSAYRFRHDDGGEGVPDSEWFDLDWDKRTRVRVTNADVSGYTDATVKLTVTYDTDMQSDFDDLRFTASDGITTLDHFVESYTASTEALVWVRVPSLPANTDTELYMYYGNGVVGDASTSTTFSMLETFEDGSMSEYSGDGVAEFTVTSGGSVYERTYSLKASDPNNGKTDSGGAYNNGYAVAQGETLRFWQYINTSTGSGDEVCTLFATQNDSQNYAVCLELYGTDRISLARDVIHNDVSGTVLASSTVTYETGWYEIEVAWGTDDSIFVTLMKDEAVVATTSATDSTYTSGGVGYSLWFYHGAWDMYSARPMLTTEPAITFGAEQVSGGASWRAPRNTSATGVLVDDVVRVRFLVENTGLTVTDQNYEIEYAPKGSAPSCEAVNYNEYTEVPNQASCGTSAICMQSSTYFTNLSPTIDLLGGEGLFVSGQVVEDASNNTGNITVQNGEYTELEYALTPTSNATDSNYCFRVTNEGSELDSYTRVAEMELLFAPNITSVSLNAGQDIILSAGATTTVYATGTVSDLNGWEDLEAATSTIFRSGVTESCSLDNNNCYISGSSQCQLTNCSGNSCDVICSADMYYHADPTDAGTFAAETWRAMLTVSDIGGSVATATAPSIDLLTLRAIAVDSTINYGALAVNSDTGSYNATTSIENIGNDSLDLAIEGSELTDGGSSVIPASQQRFATSTFTYSSCVFCSQLDEVATNIKLDLTKPASTTPAIIDEVYWGISIPFGVAGTAHQGVNIFYAIGEL